MHLLPVVLLIAVLAALVLAARFAGRTGNEPPSRPERGDPEELAAALAEAAGPLLAVMEHPRLGGPGFLTIRLPQQSLDGGGAAVTAQFPNISDALYRRIVRGELDREELVREGVPGAFFACGASFETESGGMVILTARVQGAAAPAAGGPLSGRGAASDAHPGGRVHLSRDFSCRWRGVGV